VWALILDHITVDPAALARGALREGQGMGNCGER
jgi:hypothetical protein